MLVFQPILCISLISRPQMFVQPSSLQEEQPMRLVRSITAIFVAALMLALLAACGGGASPSGGTSESGGSIPLFAGAKPLEGGSPMAVAIDAAKQQLKQQQNGADTTVDAYTLPAGTSFD